MSENRTDVANLLSGYVSPSTHSAHPLALSFSCLIPDLHKQKYQDNYVISDLWFYTRREKQSVYIFNDLCLNILVRIQIGHGHLLL